MIRWGDLFDPEGARTGSWSIDLAETPMEVATALAGADHFAFLDTSAPGVEGARYSVLAWQPFLVLASKGDQVRCRVAGTWHHRRGDVLALLDDVLQAAHPADRAARPDDQAAHSADHGAHPGDHAAHRTDHAAHPADHAGSDVPYPGGAIGYLGYDLYRLVERYDRLEATDDLALPDSYLAFYDTLLVFDHESCEWFLTCTSIRRGSDQPSDLLARRAADLRARLEASGRSLSPEPVAAAQGSAHRSGGTSLLDTGRVVSNMARDVYLVAVERALEHIRAGDVYQLNLSQRFQTVVDTDPLTLFAALRDVNPSAFGAFLPYDGHAVISSSPELFLQRRGSLVETRPIKGTRPRGRDLAEDLAHRESLLRSAKDRAELAMIVDLERNDLGRVCEYGTVEVAEHRRVAELPTVLHTVSTVRGRLRRDVSTVDLLRATFPGGSVTGCPKIRAIEIIDQLEPTRRNAYCGSIGWIGYSGDLTLNIAIRTVIAKGQTAFFQAGGAIVADSDPEAEYAETLDKAVAVRHALDRIATRSS